MGKNIIQQARGKGSLSYRVSKRAFAANPGYPKNLDGEWVVVKLISSPGHSAPLAKFVNKQGEKFYNYAAHMLYVGRKINFGGSKNGDIAKIGELKNGTEIFNIEHNQKDGGQFVQTAGTVAVILGRQGDIIRVRMPSKQEKKFSADCRATVGRIAGDGRLEKPILKAGKNFFIRKVKNKLWPRTSAVKMNKIDHPFGSGRGKRIKSKIAKRNSPPGKKVGLLRPRRTGRKKR
ncbi:MAG: 50S ribosomal protein L2 [Nanoarchaeota archaeon]|nr:50S ribosomal protein L2 [Nanoarchaeota archaeon]